MSANEHLERRISTIRKEYGEEMTAKDIARAEKCSTETASRRMNRFEFGALTKRNARVVRCYRDGYIDYLRGKTVILRATA